MLAEAAAWVDLARPQGLTEWPDPGRPAGQDLDTGDRSADGTGSRPRLRPLEEAAVRLATVDGAAAMGWGAFAGVIVEGRRADLVGIAIETAPDRVYADLVEQGAGRQVLTVLGGVRKARRDDPERDWPDHELRED